MEKDYFLNLFNARYESIRVSSSGDIEASDGGCGCCSSSDTIDKKQLKDIITELEQDVKKLKELYRKLKPEKDTGKWIIN